MTVKKIGVYIFAILVAACAQANKDRPDCQCEDGAIEGTDAAVVKISLSRSGMPKVNIETVVVEVGQRIVWVGPDEITIRFPNGSPFDVDKLVTRDAVINRVVPAPTSKHFKEYGKDKFKYDVIVGKQVLDPFMIVVDPK